MAGIYIHFPFCKQARHYCNFHFSTNGQFTDAYLKALEKELHTRRDYLTGNVGTVYIGGGTPSLMSTEALDNLFERLNGSHTIEEEAEVTLEANPDDLNTFRDDHLQYLRGTQINRLSIGVQSFQDADLKFMNRAHSSEEALSALKKAKSVGFDNITADLIYGTPTLSDKSWLNNIQRLIDLEIPHISAYALTVEAGTALDKFIKNGKVEAIDDHKVADQFEMLVEVLQSNGFEHYEISNFAKPGRYAKHNTNYWKGVPYLGLGPSAHSFDGIDRQWNIANTPKYIKGIEEGKPEFEVENLKPKERFNEYIMTSLRTMWGVDLNQILERFGKDYHDHFESAVKEHIPSMIHQNDSIFTLNSKGKLYA
ncbi:MAG: radical SAM family heme chaperone HemW, partial [Flavobacteriales bacterium]|nr:radical SAM family heme chaperone HemW [Flavobacteriales bacterium]